MNNEIIREQVIEILEDICATTVTDETATLQNDLQMDSLRMVMLLVMIEDTFDIELDESDMNPFALLNVQDVIDLVVKYKIKREDEKNG